MNAITFETIAHAINALDLEALGASTTAPPPDPAACVQRVVVAYRAVRPLLAALAVVPLVPPKFREVVRIFLATTDQLAEIPAADFKAGKDL
jgi:hypothetical protein